MLSKSLCASFSWAPPSDQVLHFLLRISTDVRQRIWEVAMVDESKPDLTGAEDRKVTISCERCKQRKLKCDRGKPSCQRCIKAHASCEYPGRRKPGFPAGHRQVLENKITRLEAEVQRLRNNDNTIAALEDQQDVPSPNESSTLHASDNSPAEPLDVEQLSSRRSSQAPPLPTYERTQRIKERKPPTDLVLSLTSLYFRHIHPWFPFLNTQRVFADMASMHNPSLLYHALFGVSLPYSHDSRLDLASSDAFWMYSKRRIFVDNLEEPSYSSLEALTILTLDLSGMTNGPQVWGALAVSIKLAMQLKSVGNRVLRTSASELGDTSTSNADQLYRNRLFWAIYMLDTYITMTTNHPSDLTDYHVQHFLPTRYITWRGSHQVTPDYVDEHSGRRQDDEIEFATATSTFVFSYQLELADLSRRLHNVHIRHTTLVVGEEFYERVQNFVQCSLDLSEWYRTLPAFLLLGSQRDKPPPVVREPPMVAMLHAYYHALVVHLHSLSAYPPSEALHAHLSHLTANSQQTCLNSVHALVEIAATFTGDMSDKLGWPFAWSMWVAARYLLVQARLEAHVPSQPFSILLECIEKLGKYWQISMKYWRLLTQAFQELQSQGSPAEQNSQGVLAKVTDLQISASDLEDQFRTDSMLHNAMVARNQIPLSQGVDPGFGMQAVTQDFNDLLSNDMFFNMSGIDTWFSVPLYASSGYQQ